MRRTSPGLLRALPLVNMPNQFPCKPVVLVFPLDDLVRLNGGFYLCPTCVNDVADGAKRGREFGACARAQQRLRRGAEAREHHTSARDGIKSSRVLRQQRVEAAGDKYDAAALAPLPGSGGPRRLSVEDLGSRIHAFLIIHEFDGGTRHTFRRDAQHAAVVGRAIAQQARSAVGRLADYARARASRRRRAEVGRPENGHGGNAESGGYVHRSGVVREKHAARGGEVDETLERGFAGDAHDRNAAAAQFRSDAGTKRPLARRAENHNRPAAGARYGCRGFHEALGWPLLGAAVLRSGTDTQDGRRNPEQSQQALAFGPGLGNAVEQHRAGILHAIDNTGAAQQFQIVYGFVRHRLRRSDGLCEKQPAPVAVISDSARYAGCARR